MAASSVQMIEVINMSCREIRPQLPDYVRDTLPAGEARAVQAHLDGCQACRHRLELEESLMTELAERFPAGKPLPGFEERMFRSLVNTPHTGQRIHLAWGSAVAAALVLGLWIGQSTTSVSEPDVAQGNDMAGVVEPVSALNPVERTVKLAFTAGEALDDVTLTLNLPPHAELTGLPGQQQVRWQVSLEQGDNVLTLPLRLLFPGEGELVAELDAGGQQKVFRTRLPEYPEPDGNATDNPEEPAI